MARNLLLPAVVLASLVPIGCLLQAGSGGYAAVGSGAGGSDDNDGSPPVASGDAGAGGGGSGSGGGAAVGGGAAMNCSALPFGCICSPTEPSQVGACNIRSVIKMAGQQGVCCDNEFNCICVAYECVRINPANCACGLAAASLVGTRVENCSGTTANSAVKCCRSYGQCICSTADCLLTEAQVSGCSVQDLLICDVGNSRVDHCEGAGGRSQ